ncbi:MAG TPA: thiamine pyrophosphate-dependent enzyme [Verrucomicrobiae bacterium]|jgi:thiamine pyrophosphate-dependent acetolactate synthase large subunit-like protein|nr:thiamine pyrophosphate-dependent enzyme [Verrucomicrobiae bacterium]
MQRYDYLKAIAGDVGDALVVAAGWAAREWQALRPGDGNFRPRTLGLASSISLGIALGLPRRKVIAIDGDGAFLMNLCGVPTIAWQNPPNLIHLLFDNQCYEASGASVTATVSGADAVALVKGAGYKHACWVNNPEDFRREFLAAMKRGALSFIAAKVEPGQPKLPPIRSDELENKYRFIRYIEETEKKSILGPSDHRPK